MLLLEYRELIINLVISDLKIKYSNSILGFAWSLINPLLMMAILYLVFNNVFKSGQNNFIIFLLIGILSWRFFSLVTASSLQSIVSNPSLIKKIYIPREALTISKVISGLISSVLEFAVLLPLLVALSVGIRPTILLFPAIQFIYFLLICGISLILASVYVYVRDLNQIWEVMLQLGFFASPIVYSPTLVPADYRFLYMLNPIARLISMYRDVFLYGVVPALSDFLITLTFSAALLMAGAAIFKRLSRRFAEEV
ncbi:ABC transporter permease [Methanocella conradii]|uniref:ABC transporter permease n=1 Tax=Methanocella conradii TaxID=1175444 RepID=UPI0024B350BA|nr:ABC transporter permease [Methanocella conradii]MDI6896848.1 ABC transporter permease [Methanocella conradii]